MPLRGRQLDAEIIDRIHKVSQGNAYAVESFIRAMLDAAVLRPSWGRWKLDADELAHLALPEDMAELLEMHLDQLAERTRKVLVWMALFTNSAAPDVLAACTGLQGSELDQVYSEAAQAGLIRIEADGGWALVHDSLRHNLLDSIDDDSLRFKHQTIAEALDDSEVGQHQLYQLAHHYARGQTDKNPKRAVEVSHRAGRLARENFAFKRAHAFYQSAAELAERHGVAGDGQLDADLGEIAARTGHLSRAKRHLNRALERIDEPTQRASLRGELVQVHLAQLEAVEGREELERAFGELEMKLPAGHPVDLAGSLTRWARSELRTRMPRLFGTAASAGEQQRLRVLLELYSAAAREDVLPRWLVEGIKNPRRVTGGETRSGTTRRKPSSGGQNRSP
jgi:tetratricopeptide (TPR) repeat protein